MGCHHLKIRAKQGTGKGDREKKEGLPESTTIDDEQRTDDSDGRASQAKKKNMHTCQRHPAKEMGNNAGNHTKKRKENPR
jgi:hypothetical protein